MAHPGHCSSPMQLSPQEQSVVKAVAARRDALVAGGAVVIVTGTVGSTTPVSPNGCRDTTVIADTTTQTATNPSTPAVTALDQAVQD